MVPQLFWFGIRHGVLFAGTACGILSFPGATRGQAVITWNVGSGNWNVSTNWSPVSVPDTTSENAIIGNGGTATLDAT